VRDQLLQAALPGFLPFGAHHPEGGRHPVGGRLRLEEFPRRGVAAKDRFELRIQAESAILIGVQPGPRLIPSLEGGPTAWMHETLPLQLREAPDVDIAPDAALAPGRKPLRGGAIGKRVANAVDPTEAELLVDNLGPGD